MSLETAIQTVKAVGDPTRLRLLALLGAGEATVGELQQILGQSQPRVSRHLKLLDEAGLVTKFRDGQWTYYQLMEAGHRRELAHDAIRLAGDRDETLVADAVALARVKRERERAAYASPLRTATSGNAFSGSRPDAALLATVIDDVLGDERFGDVLDVGSGAGNLLGLLGSRARRVVGVDASKRMRLLSRSRVHQAGIANCSVRNGELQALPFDDASFDLVVLDEVLSTSRDRRGGLREAQRVLRNEGRLIIVDRVRPVARQLTGAGEPSTTDAPLIENQLTAQLSELGYRVTKRNWLPGRVMEFALLVAEPEAELLRTGTDV
jgi:DNA-binding transcriptional ArsR family regulator